MILSFATMRFFAVIRQTVKVSVLWRCPQKWVNPKKLKVSGFPSPHGIRSLLKTQHNIVGIANDDDIAFGRFPAPDISPQIEEVMKIHVRDQWRCHSPYTKGNLGL